VVIAKGYCAAIRSPLDRFSWHDGSLAGSSKMFALDGQPPRVLTT
jgi:hypothetical protein